MSILSYNIHVCYGHFSDLVVTLCWKGEWYEEQHTCFIDKGEQLPFCLHSQCESALKEEFAAMEADSFF